MSQTAGIEKKYRKVFESLNECADRWQQTIHDLSGLIQSALTLLPQCNAIANSITATASNRSSPSALEWGALLSFAGLERRMIVKYLNELTLISKALKLMIGNLSTDV